MRKILLGIVAAVSALGLLAAPASASVIWDRAPYVHWTAGAAMPANGFDGIGQWYCTGNDPTAGPGQSSPAWYYATSNIPFGQTGAGYFGMQKDSGGKRVIFSIWGSVSGRVTSGGVAEQFQESGTGWHLLVPYNWVAGDCYFFYVLRGAGGPGSWDFWVFNNNTQQWTAIGELVMPDNKGIGTYQTNFVEWYGPQASTCAGYPRSDVYFYPPSLYTGGAGYAGSFAGYDIPGVCPASMSQGPGIWQHVVMG